VSFFRFGENSMQSMEKLRPLALLLLRIGLGVVFMHNGFPKFTWEKQASMQEMVQDGFPAFFTYVAGTLELGGGAVLVAGLYTRMVGLLLAGEMAIAATRGEHMFSNPLAVEQYELPLVLAVGAFALATFGAGSISLDGLLFGKRETARGLKS
jgi:putative oxidoreductase